MTHDATWLEAGAVVPQPPFLGIRSANEDG